MQPLSAFTIMMAIKALDVEEQRLSNLCDDDRDGLDYIQMTWLRFFKAAGDFRRAYVEAYHSADDLPPYYLLVDR